jgi:nanoRNase/pAp phosphatase (c-di-AMP/oligoRNAs hydrolase)
LITHNPNPIDEIILEKLREAAGKGPVLIVTHHNPDPDGLASGYALSILLKKAWGIQSRLIYTGLVGRVENRAMLKYLTPEWQKQKTIRKFDPYSAIALVDTQTGCGNHSSSKKFCPSIVIDHHQSVLTSMGSMKYVDIRTEMGATSTMLFQYLEAAGIEINSRLATALFYGLKTDTRGLSRSTTCSDEYAYFKLLANVDHHKLAQVEQAQLPLVYFRAFDNALRSTRVYGKAVITVLEHMHSPDLPAEIADLLIRLSGTKAALCMGQYNDTLNLSLRTTPTYPYAGSLIHQLLDGLGMAGGHRVMAGGQVPLGKSAPNTVEAEITKRFLQAMGERSPGKPLLSVKKTQ